MILVALNAFTGWRHYGRFDPVSPQVMCQGFDIGLRAPNWIGRKRERDMCPSQDGQVFPVFPQKKLISP